MSERKSILYGLVISRKFLYSVFNLVWEVVRMSTTVTVGSMAFKLSRKYSGFDNKFIPVGLRKKIFSFSASSKRNFLWRLQTLDFKKLACNGYSAYFVTLTYQRDFFLRMRNLKLAKRDLDRFFRQELKRFLGNNWFSFWKLEFHKSGVPHFHLFLVVSAEFGYKDVMHAVNEAWIKSACFDILNKPISDGFLVRVLFSMVKASTQVLSAPLDLSNILMTYVSKEVGKEFQVDVPENQLPGRFWGIYNRKLYKSFVREICHKISDSVFYRLRRDLRRWLKSKGYNFCFRSQNGIRVFYINSIGDFERLLVFYGVGCDD